MPGAPGLQGQLVLCDRDDVRKAESSKGSGSLPPSFVLRADFSGCLVGTSFTTPLPADLSKSAVEEVTLQV